MSVAIVTDSTASLSAAAATDSQITVVPLQVIIGPDTYVEGPDVTADMLAEALQDFVQVSTSRPSPESFADAYARAADGGATHVVSIHLSAKISGTYESAVLAAKDAPIPVECVDSGQVGIATGFAALQAARVRDAGADAVQVVDAATTCCRGSATLFYVDTLEYLRRGGRVGSAAALIGSALAVKPILTVDDGVIVSLEKVRTSSKALARLEVLAAEKVAQIGSAYDIGVQHLHNPTVAKGVAERLGRALECDDIGVYEVGASIGAHVGPGMVSISVTPHATAGR